MRKTLILHIGHFKTGTTALQVFCTTNQKALRRLGIDYTGQFLNHAKHSRPAFALYRATGVTTLMHGYRSPAPPEQIWAELFDAVLASKSPRVLVSSEEFMRLGAHPAAEERLAQIIAPMRTKIDFQIIAYLRPPQSHLNSWYNQLVKMNIPVPGFNEALRSVIEPVHYDYGLALGPWLRLFGPEALTIRPYTDTLRQDDALYRDFLGALGLPEASLETWLVPPRDANPRMDDRLVELARILRLLEVPPGRRERMLARAEGFLSRTGAPDADLAEIAQRSVAGLAALADLPGNGLDIDAFTRQPPQPEDPRIAEQAALFGLMLQEHNLLSAGTDKRFEAIMARLEALEAQIGKRAE